MTPQQMSLAIYRGDSYSWSFTLWNDVAGTEPFDLTGAVAAAEIRAKSGSPVLVALDCTVVQPNTVEVELTAANSALLNAKAAWDLQLTLPDGVVKTVVAGPVVVTADITQSGSTP